MTNERMAFITVVKESRRGEDRPGALHVQVVDVLSHRVVSEHGGELLLEVGPQSLDQGGPCRDKRDQQSPRLASASHSCTRTAYIFTFPLCVLQTLRYSPINPCTHILLL